MNPEQREFGAKMFAALANKSRLHIVEFLAQGPASVNEIAQAVGLKQSVTSQHLAALQNAGVVVCNPEGHLHIYELRGPGAAHILELVEEFFELHLENLRQMLYSRV